MKHLTFFLALTLFLLGPSWISPQPQAGVLSSPGKSNQANYVTYTYLPLSGDILNPERGFRYSSIPFLSTTDYSAYRSLGTSVVYVEGNLQPYRTQDLPVTFLNDLNAAFTAVRAGGVKVVLRFKYNDGPPDDADASLSQILLHIQQLTPILQQNADVIAWLHAGFIGQWGEWHDSTNGLDTNLSAKTAVLNALAAALPPNRFILLRYPPDITTFFPTPLTTSQAFNGTLQARVGFHNDCFISADDDVGTYPTGTRPTLTAYLAQTTQFTPADGETCASYPTLQACSTAIAEMTTLHWSSLNIEYHPAVISSWTTQGCFDEIKRRLGYRLVLQDATLPTLAGIGQTLNLQVHLTNEGFASPLNPRPFFVVLTGPATVTIPVSGIDPRRWLPGNHNLNFSITVPNGLPVGNYRLALWLPDEYASLRSDPRYSIRFANQDVWDATNGWNVLGTIQLVQPSLPATGFPRGRVSLLPPQPREKAYTQTDLILEIPALGIRAPIVGVLRSGNTWDVSWLGNSVGWLEGSAFPTWPGNTVLTAHVWDADNTPGVFVDIKKLKYGDRFTIHAFGQTYVYEVRENTWLWGANRVDKVFKHEELDWVTLLTCEGYNPLSGNYLFRRMVRAVLVEVK